MNSTALSTGTTAIRVVAVGAGIIFLTTVVGDSGRAAGSKTAAAAFTGERAATSANLADIGVKETTYWWGVGGCWWWSGAIARGLNIPTRTTAGAAVPVNWSRAIAAHCFNTTSVITTD